MTKYKPRAKYVPRYTVAQSETLEAVGAALKRRRINFATATELRNLIRAGHVEQVSAALNDATNANVRLLELLEYADDLKLHKSVPEEKAPI